MSELANFDDDLRYFLMQHTAVLLTSNRKLRRGLIFMVQQIMVSPYISS